MYIYLCQEENLLFFIYFHLSNFETLSFIPAINFSLYFNIMIQENLCVLLSVNYHQLKGLLLQSLGSSKPLATLDMALHQQDT